MLRRAALALALLALPASPALADGGGDERDRGSCGRGATSELRVQRDDGRLRVRFRLDSRRAGAAWRVVMTHERRIVVRTTARTGPRGSFRLERRLPDLTGSDTVRVRASGPRGVTCTAAVTLWG